MSDRHYDVAACCVDYCVRRKPKLRSAFAKCGFNATARVPVEDQKNCAVVGVNPPSKTLKQIQRRDFYTPLLKPRRRMPREGKG